MKDIQMPTQSSNNCVEVTIQKNGTNGNTIRNYISKEEYDRLSCVVFPKDKSDNFCKTYTGKTIFITAKLSSAMSNGQYRCLFGSNGANRNFNLYFYNDGNYKLHFSAAGQGGVSAAMTYTPGSWGTFAITQSTGGVLTYYFNGQQLGLAQTGQTFYQYVTNGSENVGASDNYWSGLISVVGIYGSALTADQILTCHNSVRTRYGL